ncbi:MAG: transposase domain-containing protein [Brevinema sp.]
MREKYYTSKEIGNFLQIGDRHVRRLAEKEYWEYREVKKNGAQEKRYPLSTLPLSIQAKIQQAQKTDLAFVEDTPINRLSLEPYNRAVMEARLSALDLFKKFHKEYGGGKDKAISHFIRQWQEIASPRTLEILPKFTKRSFYHWDTSLAKGGIISLAPNYGKRKGITKVPEQFQELILDAYLNQNQRTARGIHKHLIHQMAITQLGASAEEIQLAQYKRLLMKEFPYKVVLRFIENHTSKGLRDKARGNRSQREKTQAYITRDPSSVLPNQIWVSDGHDANNYVFNEYGKVIRPVVVVWQDIRSRMIVGWEIDETENTDLIITSLCNGVEQHGVPHYAYVDNGKAYINKRTADKVHSENKLKAYSMLGITEQVARPYNGKEKPVERTWGTMDNDFAKFLPGYVGKNALSKPEGAERDLKKGNLLTLEEYKDAFTKWVRIYNTNLHTGMGMDGKSPAEVYLENIVEIRRVDKDTITLLRMVTVAELRTVTAGGKIRYNNREYIAPELLHYIGLKVELALDPKNLNIAYIYYEGKFITKAEGMVYADFFDSPNTQKTLKQHSRQKSTEHKMNKRMIESKKNQSEILLAEKTKAIESKKPELFNKEEKPFDRYGHYINK